MLINKPCCDFKNCKLNFDGNCIKTTEYERCSYNRQKTEIDILIRKKDALRDEIAELQAELERHKAEHKDFAKEIMVFDRANELKAEAINDFAVKLCEDRVANDPVVIAVKALLEHTNTERF